MTAGLILMLAMGCEAHLTDEIWKDVREAQREMRQLAFQLSSVWYEIKDGNDTARDLFNNHYSRKFYKDGRNPLLFVGPGQKMVLVTPAADALFVWRKFISGDTQEGVNCAVFRNEGSLLSSEFIRTASTMAWERWPGERLYTYINPRKIRSTNPGYCFKQAGWRKCGVTKWNKLIILECVPWPNHQQS